MQIFIPLVLFLTLVLTNNGLADDSASAKDKDGGGGDLRSAVQNPISSLIFA